MQRAARPMPGIGVTGSREGAPPPSRVADIAGGLLSRIPPHNVILVFGAPRSGTTWVAKLLDSHPDVLYRHEPDTILRDRSLPTVCARADFARYTEQARSYLRQLFDVRTLKTSGSLPVFAKSFRTPMARLGLAGAICGARALEMALPAALRRRIALPDLLRDGTHEWCGESLRPVLKSVSSRGRAGLFAHSLPGSRAILVLRDPCAQIASIRRGLSLGKLDARFPAEEICAAEPARRYGLTPGALQGMQETERFAWHWVVLNEKVLDDLRDGSALRIVMYHDLVARTLRETRAIFAFAGLSWQPSTERFIARSTTYRGPQSYFGVYRDSLATLRASQCSLPEADRARVLAIVRRSRLASLCGEGLVTDPAPCEELRATLA